MRQTLSDVCWIGALVLGAWLTVSASAQTAPPVMAGQYQCEGTNPDGSPYTIALGVLSDGLKYQLSWRDPQGEMVGLGYVSGSTLSAAIATPQRQAVGLVVYTIQGQTLAGTWMAFGQPGTMTETCVPAGAREAASRE